MREKRICSVEGCGKVHLARGWCLLHYARFHVHGEWAVEARYHGHGWPMRYLVDRLAEPPMDECMLWPYAKTPQGYGVLRNPETKKNDTVHFLSCTFTWGERPTAKHHAAHGPCHDRACFNPRHLSWETAVQNSLDRRRDGTSFADLETQNAHLTANTVREIRAAYAAGERAVELVKRFGVSQPCISHIVNRKSWRHVV